MQPRHRLADGSKSVCCMDKLCAALDRCMEIVAEEARDGWRLVQVIPMLSERVAYMQGSDRTWGYRVVLERPVGEE